jgi:hypothetical protein
MIEARCRLKAEGARWAARRQRRIAEGTDFEVEIAPLDRDIIERAKSLPNCFLWMNHPSGPSPADLALFDQLADCFETAADAVELLRSAHEDADSQCDLFDDALLLGAESQSALRVAVAQIDGPADDDQQNIFRWLRRAAGERQTFINRYMRIDDPADPANNGDLAARIEALDNRLQEARNVEKNRRRLLSKIRYEAKKTQEGDNDAEAHWDTLVRSVDDLVSTGVPPSNRDMREYLLPIVDDFPDLDEISGNVQKVLQEIDRYLASLSATDRPPVVQEVTDEVRTVASLLKGRAVLLIGGVCRPHAKPAIETAFGISELLWPSAEPHEPLEKFRPLVTREDVAVVLLAIRWSSHSYGEVSTICEEFGKPLVRLPGGYNPNQIAVQILEQCGDRLRGSMDMSR